MPDNKPNLSSITTSGAGGQVKGSVKSSSGTVIETVQKSSTYQAQLQAIRIKNINDAHARQIAATQSEYDAAKKNLEDLDRQQDASDEKKAMVAKEVAALEEKLADEKALRERDYAEQALQAAYNLSAVKQKLQDATIEENLKAEQELLDAQKKHAKELEDYRESLIAQALVLSQEQLDAIASGVNNDANFANASDEAKQAEISRRVLQVQNNQRASIQDEVDTVNAALQSLGTQISQTENSVTDYEHAQEYANEYIKRNATSKMDIFSMLQKRANDKLEEATKKRTTAEKAYADKFGAEKQKLIKAGLSSEEAERQAAQNLANSPEASELQKAKGEEQGAAIGAELARAASQAISKAVSAVTNGVNTRIGELISGMASVNARIQGAGLLSSYQAMTEKVKMNVGLNPLVSQKKVIDNIKEIVDRGVAYNVEQRAFLATISDKIATTFDAFDSNLLRIIRLQQADTTGARLGMEASLTQFLNNMYSDTSYLGQGGSSGTYDTVTANLIEATSQMTRNQSISFEYTVQKWLGSMSSLGLSDTAVSNISTAINQLATGDVTALASNSTMQNLFAVSAANAGLDFSKILTNGMEADTTNKLLESMVKYLRDIAQNENNMVVKKAFGDVFGMNMSDFRAISNLTNSDIKTISNSNMSYASSMLSLGTQMALMTVRTPISEMLSNVYDNMITTVSDTIAKSPVLYSTWMINDFIESQTGGINIPFVSAAGFGLDLNANVNQIAKLAMVGIGSLAMIPQMVTSISAAGGFNLASWGGSDYTVRGQGFTGITAGSLKETSFSAQVGNASSQDAYNQTIGQASEDAYQTSEDILGVDKEEAEVPDHDTDDLYDAMITIQEQLADLTVKIQFDPTMVMNVGGGY